MSRLSVNGLFRLTRSIIIIGIITFIMVEIALRTFDPQGHYTTRTDWLTVWTSITPHETGYRFPPGKLDMIYYDVTTLEDGTRYVPDSRPYADCSIAAIGDSLTWGLGVEDSETWVNLLAQDIPATWRNTARSRYNAVDVLALHDYYPADGYIWLHYQNDVEVNDWQTALNEKPSFLPFATYIYFRQATIRNWQPALVIDIEAHDRAAGELEAEDNVLIFAMEGFDYAPDSALLIHPTRDPQPRALNHPGAQGHRQLADDMLPYVQDFVNEVCP